MKMIKLKDLLIESSNDISIETEMEQLKDELTASAKEIKSQVSEVNESSDLITESLVVSTILSAPKLIEIFGKIVRSIGKKLSSEGVSNVGEWIVKTGHWLEKNYIGFYKRLLKFTGIARKSGIKSDAELEMAAKVLFYGTLAVAAVLGGLATLDSVEKVLDGGTGAASTGTAAYGASKAALSGIKTKEVIDFARELLKKFKK